jgi:hypothetical protein
LLQFRSDDCQFARLDNAFETEFASYLDSQNALSRWHRRVESTRGMKMGTFTLYGVGQYGSPFTSDDRDRTIAALYVALGSGQLGQGAMRRDVLRFLMSSSAVGHWLTKRWLEKCGKTGRVELLRLTAQGLNQCGSLAGPSVNVSNWMRRMTSPQGAGESKVFQPLA